MTKSKHVLKSSDGGTALADDRSKISEVGATHLMALDDVDIPTDSEGDGELAEVQVN